LSDWLLRLRPGRSFDGDKAFVSEGAPSAEVGVEERSNALIAEIPTALGLSSHDTFGGGGDSRADFSVALLENDADDTTVHKRLRYLYKSGVLKIGAVVNHTASDLVRD